MLEYTRLESILTYLREHQTATVVNLAKRLYASEATIRRDLTVLEKQGQVKRLHGGAVLVDDAQRELPLYLREQQHIPAKKAAAATASTRGSPTARKKNPRPSRSSTTSATPASARCSSRAARSPSSS